MTNRKVVIIDGNDGTGKTTVAKKLAEALSGTYIKPFEIADPLLIWLHKNRRYQSFHTVAMECLEKAFRQSSCDEWLVMDRGWPTALSVSDVSFGNLYDTSFFTIVLQADTDTILARHQDRGEHISLDFLNFFNTGMQKVIEQFELKTLDTTNKSVADSVNEILRIMPDEHHD